MRTVYRTEPCLYWDEPVTGVDSRVDLWLVLGQFPAKAGPGTVTNGSGSKDDLNRETDSKTGRTVYRTELCLKGPKRDPDPPGRARKPIKFWPRGVGIAPPGHGGKA